MAEADFDITRIFEFKLVADRGHLLADEICGRVVVDRSGDYPVHGQIGTQGGIHLLQLFEAGELGQLRGEFLVAGRIHRVLVLQLGDQQLEEIIFQQTRPVLDRIQARGLRRKSRQAGRVRSAIYLTHNPPISFRPSTQATHSRVL